MFPFFVRSSVLIAGLFAGILPLQEVFAANLGCFLESATIDVHEDSVLVSASPMSDEVLFFQNNILLASTKKINPTRAQYDYDMRTSPQGLFLSDADKKSLVDDLGETQWQIDPLDAPAGFSVILNFGREIKSGSFDPKMSIQTQKEIIFEISRDGNGYVRIDGKDLSSQSFTYLRISFPREQRTQSSIVIETLRFDIKQPDYYLIRPIESGSVIAYRGWSCSQGERSTLENQQKNLTSKLNTLINTQENFMRSVSLSFTPLSTSGRDSDSDSMIDMRDNCPSIANVDQRDRNFDGVGDLCSDDDSDGIIGAADNCPTIKNADQRDQNANDIGDACEFDSDGDGVTDGVDNCIRSANPDQRDVDQDSVGDICDRCRLFDPEQLDLNQNNIGDVCEAHEKYIQTHDSDADGILDAQDNAPKTPNPDQKDTDHDMVGDVADNCPAIKNADQRDQNKNNIGDACEDTDRDGMDGWRDNCPSIANPDQEDANNDGIGNLCEDNDHDGLYNPVDNCPVLYNPDQKDTDKDRIGNVCDEEDNRFIESNKGVFIALFVIICLGFISGIVFFLRKLTR